MVKVEPVRNIPTLSIGAIRCATLISLLMVAALGQSHAAFAEGSVNAPSASVHIDYLPAIALVDQTGKSFSLATVKGKPVLVGFIHTSCGGVCQMMTAKMKSVAQKLEPSFASKITLVSL